MKEKILVTGASGQIGSELFPALQKKYGKDCVFSLDLKNMKDNDDMLHNFDVMDSDNLEKMFIEKKITTVYHLVALLSATGERDPNLAWHLNMESLKNILDLAVKHRIKVFWPSSIAAFGPTTPRNMTPQHTVMEPTTMYGVTKLAGELLCAYYKKKYSLDVRSIRYPGIISWKTEPGGGTTDYAIAIFYEAIKSGKYTCFLREDSGLPMMYMDDAIRATIDIMEADKAKLSVMSYNLAGISFTPRELAQEINRHIQVDVSYLPDFRQQIADSWPASIDDSTATQDWGWKPEYDLKKMTKIMLDKLGEKLGKK